MTELQELNEKLLRFAGFWQAQESQWRDGSNYAFEPNTTYKDGKKPKPDLISSLDAQVKWLWPKVYWVRIFVLKDEIVVAVDQGDRFGEGRCGRNENPALASARAIEQVIDSGG